MANRQSDAKKLYIIIKSKDGHLKHYVSTKAIAHADIVIQYGIDLDTSKLLEKGFISKDHKIIITYDVRRPGSKKEKTKK